MTRSALLTLATLFLTFVLCAHDAQAKRVALVIGNSSYREVPVLENPSNDARDLAGALSEIGFEVDLALDLDEVAMQLALESFQRKATAAEVSLVYYAGHGIEIGKENYLIPVDAKLQTDRAVRFETVSLDDVVYAAEGASELSLVIIDACRNNPFLTRIERKDSSRSLGRGLADVEPAGNSIVAFAARGGTTALDGDGRNSPYATALIAALQEPGLELGLMFRRVRDQVRASTGNRQEPWVYGTLSEDLIFLNPRAEEQATDRSLSPVEPQADTRELTLWRAVQDSRNVTVLEDFLTAYPESIFAPLAEVRIARLRASGEASEIVVTPKAPGERVMPAVVERELTRDELRDVQTRLAVLGYSPGTADGIFGQRTRGAITAYERDKDIEPTGTASVALMTRLRDEVSEADVASYQDGLRRAAEARRKAAAARRTTTTRRQQTATAAQPAPQPQPTQTTEPWWKNQQRTEPETRWKDR